MKKRPFLTPLDCAGLGAVFIIVAVALVFALDQTKYKKPATWAIRILGVSGVGLVLWGLYKATEAKGGTVYVADSRLYLQYKPEIGTDRPYAYRVQGEPPYSIDGVRGNNGAWKIPNGASAYVDSLGNVQPAGLLDGILVKPISAAFVAKYPEWAPLYEGLPKGIDNQPMPFGGV